MKLIGIEEHFITEDVLDAWLKGGVDKIDPCVSAHGGVLQERLLDVADGRVALMDETGLDVQVLSVTTPALHDLGPDSLDVARRSNDVLAAAIARHPDRFQGLATLPVAFPNQAARELERCVQTLGFKGLMLCGRVGPRNLDDASFAPIFETAAALNVPVLLHPRTPDPAVRQVYYSGFSQEVNDTLSQFGLGWHYDAGMQFIRLVLSGIFDRLPNLQVILGHWGEVVLFYVDRMKSLDRVSGLDRPIADYLRRNLYVTGSGMNNRTYMARATEIVGADRLLFSTDYPYQYKPDNGARRFLDECGLEGQEKAGFASENWLRLTGG